ncbi:MAG: EI24 domain-containing protein [Pseudomonadota bacterium]|nr:EI24 domain-containing protein [Pseudomonadota bacterium]
MLRAFFLSIGDLGDARILRVIVKSLLWTLVILAGLGIALWFAVQSFAAPYDPDGDYGWLTGAGAVVGAVLLGWLLFQIVAIAVMQMFVDDIVGAVEARHYPATLALAKRIAPPRALAMGLGSAGRALFVNTVLLPAYIVLLVTGIGTLALFLAANGWVLGRDLTDMVAARHLSRAAMRDWRATTRGVRFVLGVAVMALFVVPLVNLFAPVLGAAMATHLFHSRGR